MGKNVSKDPLVSLGKIFNLGNEGGVPSISSASQFTALFLSAKKYFDLVRDAGYDAVDINDALAGIHARFTLYTDELAKAERWSELKVVKARDFYKDGINSSFGPEQEIIIKGARSTDGECYGLLRKISSP